jgi:predicted nucleic acid-binding protein
VKVAFDSNIIIWGLQIPGMKRGNPNQSDLSDLQTRSAILFDQFKPEQVILSAISLSEVMLGVVESQRDNFMEIALRKFFWAPFDARAVALACRLWYAHRKGATDLPVDRACFRADVLIVASLKVAGVAQVFSHDPNLRKLAETAGMRASDLPTHHESDMFYSEDK